MLPSGGSMATEHVVGRKRVHKDNSIGRANTDSILDSLQYEAAFDDSDVNALAAIVVTESIHAHCDLEGYQYVLLDLLVDFRYSTTALSTAYQIIYVRPVRNSIFLSVEGWINLLGIFDFDKHPEGVPYHRDSSIQNCTIQ